MKNSLETRLGIFVALAVIAAIVIIEMVGGADIFQRGYRVQPIEIRDGVGHVLIIDHSAHAFARHVLRRRRHAAADPLLQGSGKRCTRTGLHPCRARLRLGGRGP